ncbi:hypothetical protein [Saccharopolyspora flava]|uniref:CRISPR-associated protein, APE2256 family n=1 Tax=Saccharopolyspora flava TaxID=95161 RepID=A0A1I6UJY2_9PSEU|nr:hypothetical protein [Saccharopolyspora flava]SFT01721.1 hypothetical protein SAMN05660874_04992 [Saccharopolyspora flava]
MTSRVHVIPVGLSLLKKLEGKDILGSVYERNLWQALRDNNDAESLLPAEALTELDGLPHDLCPEWQGIDVYFQRHVNDDQDSWVFVGSDTEKGSQAALLTAMRQARLKNVPLQYIDDPAESNPRLTAGACVVARIPGLDLSSPELPRQTFTALGGLGRLIVQSRPETAVVFHLSGGYKAMLPYFLTVAQAVKTKLGREVVDAYCFHETGTGSLVELPVPRFTGKLAELLGTLARVSDGGTVDVPSGNEFKYLEGLYVESKPLIGYELNPSGVVIAGSLWTG